MKCVKRLTAAQQRLVEENLPIVERVLRFDIQANPCVSGLGHEDLYQEGCVWLCNAALTFDPARGSFASYARRVVQNGLVGYCRNALSKYQRTVSLGDLEPAVLAALEAQNAVSSHTKCETPLLLAAAESQYTGVTRRGVHALALQVSGMPLTAVAVRMSAPPNHVSAWISRAAHKLRNNESFSHLYTKIKFGGTFMKMLYTANGRYIRCCTEEGTRPVIIVCEKEYEVDVQEFMVWSILNWRILREEDIGSYYEKMANNSTVTIHRSWQDCVQRLLVRGLIVVGAGDTEYDALYDLLACRFIIPIGAAWPLRVLLFLKLTFLEGISWKITRRLFHVDARSVCEKKVIRLARQTSLSCAEIIKCIEMGIRRLKDGYDVLDKLYDDNDLNCDNFAQAVREYHCSREVITAVVNLYLRQQIMIDTY